MQDRYISQIFELYEDFHVSAKVYLMTLALPFTHDPLCSSQVVLMPLLDAEVRGVASLESFSTLLLSPDSGTA